MEERGERGEKRGEGEGRGEGKGRGGGEGRGENMSNLKVSREFMARLTLRKRLSEWAESAAGSTDAIGRM